MKRIALICLLFILCSVSGVMADTVEDIYVVSNVSIEKGDYRYIKPKIYPDGNCNDIECESMDNDIAVIKPYGDGYRIYAKEEGSTEIVFKAKDSNVYAYTYVNVYTDEDDYDGYVGISRIELWGRKDSLSDEEKLTENDVITMMSGETQSLSAVIYPDNATDTGIMWLSDNEQAATVKDGVITAKSAGTAYITALTHYNGKKKTIKVNVTPYTRYPDNINIVVDEAKYKFVVGEQIHFNTKISPDDTTETKVYWETVGPAEIDDSGSLNISDKGEVIVKAYTSDKTKVAEYKFIAKYPENYFMAYNQNIGIKRNKSIVLNFDSIPDASSASENIFVSVDETGNGEDTDINISTEGNTLYISPKTEWNEGMRYVFVKQNLKDIYGSPIGINLKCGIRIRR